MPSGTAGWPPRRFCCAAAAVRRCGLPTTQSACGCPDARAASYERHAASTRAMRAGARGAGARTGPMTPGLLRRAAGGHPGARRPRRHGGSSTWAAGPVSLASRAEARPARHMWPVSRACRRRPPRRASEWTPGRRGQRAGRRDALRCRRVRLRRFSPTCSSTSLTRPRRSSAACPSWPPTDG